MASFGERLRKEREARGIELSSVSESTKISPRVLQALESNRFGDLPGRVYNRGFVRAYAVCIGADPAALLEAYEEEERRRSPMAPETPISPVRAMAAARAAPPRRRWRAWPLLLAATASSAAAVTLALWPPRDAASSTVVPPAPPARKAADPPRGDDLPQQVEAPAVSAENTPAGIEMTPALLSSQAPVEIESRESDAWTMAPEAIPSPGPNGGSGEVEAVPTPEEAVADPASPSISVREWAIGAGVVDHDLVGRRSIFQVGERAWFWTRLLGADAGNVVRHVWLHEGKLVASIDITIGGPSWRAYTRRILEPGDAGVWVAEVRDVEGRILAAETFVCAPGRTAPKPPAPTPATP